MSEMRRNRLIRTLYTLLLTAVLTVSVLFLCACSKTDAAGSGSSAGEAETAESTEQPEEQEEPEEDEETEGGVTAADPMTEEEMEADDSDGCIEDSEDLLY